MVTPPNSSSMKTLNVGDEVFLVQAVENRPNDVRLCHIGEVNDDKAVLVIKEAPSNGTGKAVLRTLGRYFLGNPVDANETIRQTNREKGLSYELPTPELYLLLENKLKRQSIRTTLEDIKTNISTLDKDALLTVENQVNALKKLVDDYNLFR